MEFLLATSYFSIQQQISYVLSRSSITFIIINRVGMGMLLKLEGFLHAACKGQYVSIPMLKAP